MSFDTEHLAWARTVIGRRMLPTLQCPWPLLCKVLGGEVWVKHENHTPTGSFKVRGSLVYLERLSVTRPEVQGIVTATRGNHGQSLAFAARAYGRSAMIVVPEGSSEGKVASARALGAELTVCGSDLEAARDCAHAIAAEGRFEMVPSYHPDLVLGAATYAAELFDSAGELDTLYVPIGTGSGICGVLRVRDLLGLRTEVVGVVAREAPAMALSVAAGRVVASDTAETFIDGVACRVPDIDVVETVASGVARVLLVSEDEAAEALRMLYRTTHNVAEPAGALALAGLLQERSVAARRRVGLVLSGGNVDAAMLVEVLSGRTPRPHAPA